MKKLLSTLIGSSLLATGIISTSATSASAACNVDNIFSDALTASECYDGTDKNDDAGDLAGFLDGIINGGGSDGSGASTDKVENYNGGFNDYFSVSSEDGLTGTITFTEDIENTFSIVLKGSTGWSAYKFDGVTAGDTFNWTMAGVPLNNGGNTPALSHASLYLTEGGSGGGVSTPEPSLMIGLAVLGGGLVASRLRKSN
jgi:hypothetical protein